MILTSANRTSSPRLLIVFVCAVCVMIALTSAEGALFRTHRGEPIDWQALVTGRVLAWGTCAAFAPPLYVLTTRWPLGRSSWRVALPLHLGASLAATVGKYSLYVPLARLANGAYDTDWLTTLKAGFLGELMFYWAIIGVAHAIFFYSRAPSAVSQMSEEQQLTSRATTLTPERISLSVGAGTEMLVPDDIRWIAAEGNYVRIHLGERQLLVRHTIGAFVSKLPPHFVRVHRSVVVNTRRVHRVEPAGDGRFRIAMSGGATVTTGRAYRGAVRSRLK